MSRYSPIAAVFLAAAIFLFDTLTQFDVAIAVLYVAVVLLSVNFTGRRGTLAVAAICIGLTLLSFAVTHGGDLSSGPVARCLVSLAAIAITTGLALRLAATIAIIGESERRYRTIFRSTGVAILEMDFSALKARLDAKRADGARSIDEIASRDPGFAREALGLMKLVNANDTTFSTFKAADLTTFRAQLPSLMPREMELSILQLLDAIWRGQSHFEAEGAMDAVDGRRLNILYTVAMPTDRKALDLVLVSIMDVTARREAENGLHQAQAELAHVSRVATLGELTVSIAHEVNQPLAGVVTNGEAGLRWLKRPEPDLGEVTASIERMIADARRASEVIKRLRALSSKATPQPTAVDLNDLVQDTLTLVQREIASQHVVLRLQLADGLGRISGDRVQLQQVIINLIVNAIQAMGAMPIGARQLAILSRSSEDGVALEIVDSGPGFAPSDEARLFSAFFTTKPEGMGMGLSICRSIVEAHGGRLRASARPSGGASFEFYLPADKEAA
jgi:two-component system sensor kinase FixL